MSLLPVLWAPACRVANLPIRLGAETWGSWRVGGEKQDWETEALQRSPVLAARSWSCTQAQLQTRW